jgi:hypothetical protein
MTTWKKNYHKHLIKLLAGLLMVNGCATYVPPAAPVQPATQYKFTQEQQGLMVAIDPFMEEDRLKTYFGTDLLANGILPVLIVVNNHNPQSGYLVQAESFSLSKKGGTVTDSKGGEAQAPRPNLDGAQAGVAAGGVIAAAAIPLLMVPAVFAIIVMDKKMANATAINENLRKNAFVGRTVLPGESHSGFVYFKVGSRDEAKDLGTISSRVKELKSDKELLFVYQISP